MRMIPIRMDPVEIHIHADRRLAGGKIPREATPRPLYARTHPSAESDYRRAGEAEPSLPVPPVWDRHGSKRLVRMNSACLFFLPVQPRSARRASIVRAGSGRLV